MKMEKSLGQRMVEVAPICILLSYPIAAWASSGGEPSISDTVSYWINFLTFVAVLFYILRKPFLSFWDQRSEQISSAVYAGVAARKAAEERLRSAEAQYSNLEKEAAELRQRIAEEALAESKRVLQEGHDRAKAIRARTLEAIQAEKAALEVRLREALAEEVMKRTESIVQSRLDDSMDKKLRQGLLGQISGAASSGRGDLQRVIQ